MTSAFVVETHRDDHIYSSSLGPEQGLQDTFLLHGDLLESFYNPREDE